MFHVVIEKAKTLIGINNGEINIAHMTTGEELINNHKVAIADDITNCIQYKKLKSESFIISSAILCLSKSFNFILDKNFCKKVFCGFGWIKSSFHINLSCNKKSDI